VVRSVAVSAHIPPTLEDIREDFGPECDLSGSLWLSLEVLLSRGRAGLPGRDAGMASAEVQAFPVPYRLLGHLRPPSSFGDRDLFRKIDNTMPIFLSAVIVGGRLMIDQTFQSGRCMSN
jgi:hypothetical protein